MDYTESNLYKKSIMQLREIGRDLHIKGTTTKNKEDLVESIVERVNKKITPNKVDLTENDSMSNIGDLASGEQQKMFADLLYSSSDKENTLTGSLQGYCIIEEGDYLSEIYDQYGHLTEVVLPYGVVKKDSLQDGDHIRFKVAMHNGQKFVSVVLSINENLKVLPVRPARTLVETKNVFEYMLKYDTGGCNVIAVLPIATSDELHLLSSCKMEHISSLVSKSDRTHELACRLTIPKLLQKAAKPQNITALVDLDRLYLVYLLSLKPNKAKMQLVRFFSKALAYSNGGSLSIVGITHDSELANLLKSYCTESVFDK